jgi:DnaJ like chaperone protein
MRWTGKLIGGALGMVLGPGGALVGALLGHQYDAKAAQSNRSPGEQFFLSTFRLMGHVAKADGRVTEVKIAAARRIMHSLRLNPQQVQLAISLFTQGKQAEFDLEEEMQALPRTWEFPRTC